MAPFHDDGFFCIEVTSNEPWHGCSRLWNAIASRFGRNVAHLQDASLFSVSIRYWRWHVCIEAKYGRASLHMLESQLLNDELFFVAEVTDELACYDIPARGVYQCNIRRISVHVNMVETQIVDDALEDSLSSRM